MMEREEYIRSRAGKENPFRVPEGYFEGLASQVMANLPDRDTAPVRTARTYRLRLRAWICTAACVCIGMFGAVMYFADSGNVGVSAPDSSVAADAQSASYDSYDEAVADYMMIDNADIYAYLTDSSFE